MQPDAQHVRAQVFFSKYIFSMYNIHHVFHPYNDVIIHQKKLQLLQFMVPMQI